MHVIVISGCHILIKFNCTLANWNRIFFIIHKLPGIIAISRFYTTLPNRVKKGARDGLPVFFLNYCELIKIHREWKRYFFVNKFTWLNSIKFPLQKGNYGLNSSCVDWFFPSCLACVLKRHLLIKLLLNGISGNERSFYFI